MQLMVEILLTITFLEWLEYQSKLYKKEQLSEVIIFGNLAARYWSRIQNDKLRKENPDKFKDDVKVKKEEAPKVKTAKNFVKITTNDDS